MGKILSLFNSIGRELYQYGLPGSIFIMDILFLGLKNHLWFVQLNQTEWYISLIICTILSVSIAHIVHAFLYIVFETTGFADKIKTCFFKKKKDDSVLKNEINIFSDKQKLYDFFVERYNNLEYFRWNLSGILFSIVIVNVVCKNLLHYKIYPYSFWINFILLIFSLMLFVLSLKTELDKNERIDALSTTAYQQPSLL